VLRHRLREQTREDVAELHRRAARWLEREGLIFEATDHLFAIPDLAEAADMIERVAGEMLSHGEVTPLLSLISRLPEDVMAAHPRLCLYQAQAFFSRGQIDAAEQRLAQAEEGMSLVVAGQSDSLETATLRRRLASGIAVGRAVLAAMRGDAAATLAFAQAGLEEIADDETADRGGAILTLGHARGLSGNQRGAEAAYEEASRLCLAAGNLYLATTALLQQAGACAWMGKTRQAAEIYRRVIEMAETQGGAAASLAGGAWIGLAARLYDWNDLAGSEQALQRAIALGEQWANDEDQVDGFARLALVHLAAGRIADSFENLRQAQELVRSGAHYPWIPAFTAALATRIALRTGQMDDANRWARGRTPDLVPDAHLTVFEEYEHLTLARVLIADQRLPEAIRLLHALRGIADAEERVSSLIEIGALTALAWQAEDDTARALETLERAVALAEAEGYVRTFVDEGIPMRGLLIRLRERQPVGRSLTRHLNRLIAAFDAGAGMAAPARASDGFVEPLSERERDVLRLLAEGRSNQDIARTLVVAPSTVKTHVHHIFAKLQASDRLQAVTRARAFGLLQQ
jgi:LuxR family maltose regulon positive regulatory protein